LHEVIMSNRTDVAGVLLDKYDPSLDINCGGVTPRSMAFQPAGGLHGTVIEMVRKYAARTRPKARELRECSKCKVKETNGGPELSRCKSCKDAFYCSRECQVADWPRHKANCKTKAVKLAKPADGAMHTLFSHGATYSGGGYKKPRDVATKEKFFIKVQAAGDNTPLLIYDKSRDFTIDLHPGTSGFSELLVKVRAEPTSMGRKCHMKAMFDENGDCFAYPYTATLKEW
jgi:MYND finger